jgi:amicyanin
MKRSTGLIIGVVAVVVIIAGLVLAMGGKSDNSSSNASSNSNQKSATTNSTSKDNAALSNAVATNVATLENYAFSPAVIKVKVGDTVTWTNKDAVQHTVTANTSSADAPNGPLFGQGETYKFTFTKAGTYTLHCEPHPYMHQIVQVTE